MGPAGCKRVDHRYRAQPRRIALVALLGLLALAAPASAHADLVTADPAPNSELDTAPTRITARFSERVEDTYTRIEVEDAAGVDYVETTRIDEGDRRQVEATLRPLPDGVFTVRWYTLSQADGHTRSGSFLLAVNDTLSTEGGAPGPEGDIPPPAPAAQGDVGAGEVAARWLGFIGATLAFGMPLAALIAAGIEQARRLQRFAARAAAAGAALAALAGLVLGVALAGRIEADLATAFATSNGAVLLQRIIWFALAAASLAIAALPRNPTSYTWSGLGTLFAGAGLWATAMGGHAAADAADALAWYVAVDWLHQAGVAFWVSGVALLTVAGVHRLPEAVGAKLVARFSPAAVASVMVIVATGIIATMDRLPAPADLVGSTFGLLVLAKAMLVIPLVLLGAYHRFVVLPRLQEAGDESRDVGALRRSAGAELAVMMVVLLLAGALTSVGPPVPGAEAGAGAPDENGPEPLFTHAADGFDVEVLVEPMPPVVGFQDITVLVVPHEGEDVNLSAVDVFATFIPPSDPFGEASPIEGHNFGGGQFHFGGAIFTEPGNWTMKITVQGELFARVDVPVEVRQRE